MFLENDAEICLTDYYGHSYILHEYSRIRIIYRDTLVLKAKVVGFDIYAGMCKLYLRELKEDTLYEINIYDINLIEFIDKDD